VLLADKINSLTHPAWRWLPRKLQTQVIGKVVAVQLQQVVLVALVVLPHLLHQMLHLLRR
jgi:hypothetical protein